MTYDKNNIFAKILRDEIPAKKVYEDDKLIAFWDIAPVAPVHILVIPKGEYKDYSDFVTKAPAEDVSYYFSTVAKIAKDAGLESFKISSNVGEQSGQKVFHFHSHILGGTRSIKNDV
ncbi:MAG: HIT domain-containing protein [Rickettsiaceae bacterium]|nr:HIT domain-containing protein [Rickettsiaceae bacterium]